MTRARAETVGLCRRLNISMCGYVMGAHWSGVSLPLFGHHGPGKTEAISNNLVMSDTVG